MTTMRTQYIKTGNGTKAVFKENCSLKGLHYSRKTNKQLSINLTALWIEKTARVKACLKHRLEAQGLS